MRRIALPFVLLLFFAASASSSAYASGLATIRLTLSRTAVLNNGRDAADITAEVKDSTGSYVPDGTQVSFTTDLGQLDQRMVPTRGGVARVRITGVQKGTARVTVTTTGQYAGAMDTVEIVFTDDPNETFQGNSYVAIQSTGNTLYSGGDRVVEATGRARQESPTALPGASLNYRNIQILADALQLDCTANAVRATGNVELHRGGKRLACSRLYYSLTSGQGYAVTEVDKRVRPVQIRGADLKLTPAENGIPPKFLQLVDLSGSELIITARQILVFPGDKLQFKRPHIYQGGQLLMSLPFYSLALYSNQLFSDQLVSVGSQGLGVNLPLYYDLSPTSTGIFSVRHGDQAGRSTFSRDNGWTLDLTEGYNSLGSSARYTGQFALTGISRSDWGARWTHSQEFGPATQASVYVDFPQHRSLYGSANLNRQFGALNMGLNLTGNRSVAGPDTTGSGGQFYLETVPKKVGRTGFLYAVGANSMYNQSRVLTYVSRVQTEGVQARFFSNPFRLDRRTTVMSYVSIGNQWASQGRSGPSMLASFSASRTFRNGNMQLMYDFTHQPAMLLGDGQHRVSANVMAGMGTRWNVSLYGSAMLDAENASLVSDFSYRVAPRWRLSLSSTIQRFAFGGYDDLEFTVGRSIGLREIGLSYSTFNHRFYFDLAASRF